MNKTRLLWVDLEMTGRDEKTDRILEVAVVITDLDLKPLEVFHRVVFQPEDILKRMDDWCQKTHGESGLLKAIPQGVPLAAVEKDLLALINKHFDSKTQVVLAGNSVGNDKRFIDEYMHLVAKRLHYRIIDVSSFKEIFREKFNLNFEKQNRHRAVDDIFESIKELDFYLSHVKVPLVTPTETK